MTTPAAARSRFAEVADRVWIARHERWDLTIAVVGGSRGVVVVDTHGTEADARGLLAGVRALGAGPVLAVVNTHEHFDHVLGNAVFRDADPAVPIHAHAVAAARVEAACARIKATARASEDPIAPEVLASRVVRPDRPFEGEAALDLGDRGIWLRHLGRGHTGGDLVVAVPDARVLVAGDLVEESAPPVYGADSHPLEWPATAQAVVAAARALGDQQAEGDVVVVPGHGDPVDPAFAARQAAEVALVADRIRTCHAEGLPVDAALAAGGWPYDPSLLGDAVARGYAHLDAGRPLAD